MSRWKNALNTTSTWKNFMCIGSPIDSQNINVNAALTRSEKTKSGYLSLLQASLKGGDERSIQRHTEINKKKLVHNRLRKLFDNYENTLNLSTIAGTAMEYGNLPSAGVITSIGKINGLNCMVIANDATVKGGTIFPIAVKKQLRAQEIAFKLSLPCVYLVDSGGAFLPLQSQIFPDRNDGGRIFRNQAIMSANEIPQISVVCGSCTAGAAYIPGMSDVAIIVDKIGSIFLAGPPLVKAATGEEISEERLGGATVHCRESGVTDYFAPTEDEALEICRNVLSELQATKSSYVTNCVIDEPLYPTQEIQVFSSLENFTKQNGYEILARLLDGSKFNEFKEKYGTNLITGFGRVSGVLVGLLLNFGSLTAPDALKAAHFVQLCDCRSIPLIFLQNSLSRDTNIDTEATSVKEKGKLMSLIASTKITKITINIGGCIGDQNYTMCGSSMDPTFIFSWPESLTSAEYREDKNSVKETKLPFSNDSAVYCASRVLNDGIILPENTRKILSQCLHLATKVKYRAPLGVIRM